MSINKGKKIVAIFFGLLLFSFNSNASSNDISMDKLLVPEFVKAQIVSDGMNMNGMDVGIIQFQTDRKFAALEKFYRSEVGDIKIGEFQEWKIISWMKKKKLYTVQATYDELKKTTHGFIAVSNLPSILKSGKEKDIGKGFPSLSGSEFINDIKATDLNKKSRTIWLTNRSSIANNINFYKNRYKSKGWDLEQVNVDESGGKGALLMRKGADELNLTATTVPLMKDVNVIAVIVNK